VLAQMQELLVHLVCRDSVLQAAPNVLHLAFNTVDAKLIPPLTMLRQSAVAVDALIQPKHPTHATCPS
jgi:hypothetical protein